MDNDIRDLTADYDLFDPFDDDEDEDEAVIPLAPAEEEEGSGEELVQKSVPQKAQLSPEERIEKLLASMPGQKKLLLRIIEHCREPQTGEEMDRFTLELQEDCYSVYTPVALRELLQEAGALEYYLEDDEGNLVAAAVQGEETALLQEQKEKAVAQGAEVASLSADDYFLSNGVLVDIDESMIKHESFIEGDEEVQLDYLEIEPSKPGVWQASAAGLAAVDAVDYLANTKALLDKESQYLDIYHQILEFCAAEKYGRSSKEIDNLVNDSPLLQEPRRYSGYFVSRLEREGALEWKSGWCITSVGQSTLADYEVQVKEGVENA